MPRPAQAREHRIAMARYICPLAVRLAFEMVLLKGFHLLFASSLRLHAVAIQNPVAAKNATTLAPNTDIVTIFASCSMVFCPTIERRQPYQRELALDAGFVL